MADSDTAPQELIEQIKALAPTKSHRLKAYQVDGSVPLTVISARMILGHLSRCQPLRQPQAEAPARVAPELGDTPVQAVERSMREKFQNGIPERKPLAVADRTPPAGPSLPPLRAFTDIPKGFYATPSRTGNNDLDFWKVTKGKKGTQWADVSFVVRLTGGAGEMQVFELENIQQRVALLAIREAGIEEAGMAFANAVHQCKSCGSPLTDEESRKVGLGPTCRRKKD